MFGVSIWYFYFRKPEKLRYDHSESSPESSPESSSSHRRYRSVPVEHDLGAWAEGDLDSHLDASAEGDLDSHLDASAKRNFDD